MLIHNPSSHQGGEKTHPGAVFRCRNEGKRLERGFLPSFLTIVGSRVDKMPISPLALSTERNWMCERLKSGAKTPLAAGKGTATLLLEIFFKGTLENLSQVLLFKTHNGISVS